MGKITYPDEYTAIDWDLDIVKFIKNTKIYNDSELFKEVSNFSFPNYQCTSEKDSKQMYNIQLADIFAGIIRTSRLKSKEYISYVKSKSNQESLFNESNLKISANLKPKLELLHYFKTQTSSYKLGISFSKNKYFETFNKRNNIRIWHYVPKSEFDKAPTK